MSDENIEIQIQDKVSPSIATKLRNIASEARGADSAVKLLQESLKGVSAAAGLQKLQAELGKTAVQNQRLATEVQRTQAAMANVDTALNRAISSQTRAATATIQNATAQQTLTTAIQRTTTEQQRTATASQRLATEQQRTAAQTANAAAANDRAALAALRLQQAQDRANGSLQRGRSVMGGYIRTAAGILGVTLSANAILSSSDAYTVLQNKLQNVATSQGQVNRLTGELFELANKTRAGIEGTTTAFARFDRALKIMGKSQEDSLRMTETINKALIVSGATAQEASSALLQLSQGFNAGRLMGDEFRAVSENMPIVLDAVAKALNAPINQVKELSTQGKITSEVLFNAFKIIESQVDETFGKTTPTIAQSMTVLRNSAIEFFGEVNKATGFSNGLSKAILWLAGNMKILAVVTAAVGGALLLAFGAPLVAALAGATKAVMAFTLALASNPIGLIVVGLSAAIAYLALFRDEINLGIDDATTLGDFMRAAFEGIGRAIDNVKSIASELWASLFEDAVSNLDATTAAVSESAGIWQSNYADFFQTNRTGWAGALEAAAKTLDAIAGLLTGAATFAGRAMGEVVISTQNSIANAYNVITGWIEKVTNKAIGAANKLRALVGKSAYELVQFDRMGQAGQTEFESWGKLWAQSLEDGFNSQGGALQNVLNGLFDRSRQIGETRLASGNAQLRGSGVSQLGGDSDASGARAAERRALAMEKINTQLDNELSRLFKLQPQREAQAKLDQIEESLIQKKIKLTDEERNSIMSKIQAVQKATEVQRQFDAIYNDAVGPLREYTATQEAANKLLTTGAITQEQYSRAVTKSSEAYANSLDPMRQYNRDLDQQFKLLEMLPRQREVEQQITQVQNDLLAKGIVLKEQELAQLRERLVLLQQLNAVSQQEASLMAGSVERRQGYIDQLTAINNLLRNPDSGFTKSDAMSAIGGSDAGQFLVGSPEMMQAEVARLDEMYAQIDALRQADLISEQTAAGARLQIWNAQQNAQLQTAKTFYGHLEGLQTSNNKKLAAIGKAAAITNAIINTYQAATGAYASLASIPYVGPALGAAAAAAAIAAGMANVSAIRSQNTGFKEGGYTGSIGVNEIAGVVHGQEFVMDAATTARLGVGNLEALRSGAAQVQRNGDSAPTAPMQNAPSSNNSSENNGSQTNLRIINTLDPQLVGDFLSSPEGEQVFVNAIRRNSDSVKQAINNG